VAGEADLAAWYGKGRWLDKNGDFKRCVTLPDDPELVTRHEVHAAPPDVLVTNYSMLEYMLMRPLERPIFDRTREWLEKNPEERFLLVIDEAHLYRGAQGAEVALLIRRLRTRLGIPPERLQVICTSASFKDADYAVEFGAQLTGKDPAEFRKVQGDLLERPGAAKGTAADAAALDAFDLNDFYEAANDPDRVKVIEGFLKYRGVAQPWDLQPSLYKALESFGPMSSLVNSTMKEAQPVDELGAKLFEAGVAADVAGPSGDEPHRAGQRGAQGADGAWAPAVPRPLVLPWPRGPLGLHGPELHEPPGGRTWRPCGQALQPAARYVRLRRARAGAVHVPELRDGARARVHQQRRQPGLPLGGAGRCVSDARGFRR
jgi:hypothetical protein